MARPPNTSRGKASTTRSSRISPTASDDQVAEDGSQGLDDQDTINLARLMMESSKKRREAKRKAIELEYGKSVNTTRAHIIKAMDTERQKRNDTRRSQLELLETLIRKRALLEAKIITEIEALETAYRDCSDEIMVICKGRLDDMK